MEIGDPIEERDPARDPVRERESSVNPALANSRYEKSLSWSPCFIKHSATVKLYLVCRFSEWDKYILW